MTQSTPSTESPKTINLPETPVPSACLVTGGSGFVGQRLVEMLIERGAARVVSFDIAPKPPGALDDERIEYVQGDITKPADVLAAAAGVDCCFHIAALVGPFHEDSAYEGVNVGGCQHVLDACRHHGVRKIVMSSSPSTRFPYPDPNVSGLSEAELRARNGGEYAPVFLAPYARTKASGEKLVRDACCDELMTVAVAPHQVYGPRDPLLLPNIIAAARGGKLRIFGDGTNKISFTHVDNYCHGLILGAAALYEGSPALGEFYIVTDGGGQNLWDALDQVIVGVGLPSLHSRKHLPGGLMMMAGRASMGLGKAMSFFSKKPYAHVMRRLKLTTFTVKMLLIDRYFNIDKARADLQYKPLYSFEEGWAETIAWFRKQ